MSVKQGSIKYDFLSLSQNTNQVHPNYSIAEIGQNTEKCPGKLRRLSVTQTPVKDH